MRTVLAAVDGSAAASPVVGAALALGRLTGSRVECVHVRHGLTATPELLAARRGVSLRVVDGPVETALLDAIAETDVVAAVVGARSTPGGRRPVGRTALHVLEHVKKPVLVVPPDSATSPPTFHRLLVPLDGTDDSSRAVTECLCRLFAVEVELVVLHVFTTATAPRVLDRPDRDLALIGDEFLARHCPDATHIELRTGSVGDAVATATRERSVDLVVMSWSQTTAAGHAATIADVVAHAAVPVLLLPIDAVIDLDAAGDREGSCASA